MRQFTFCQSTVEINFVVSAILNKLSVTKIKGCPWLTCGLIILEMKGDNEPAIISLLYIVSLSKNENMFKKSKIRQIKTTEKRGERSPSGGVESRTFDL